MSRKVSMEVRRKLLEAAKARWARREVSQRPASIPPVVAALDVAEMERRAGASVMFRGRAHLIKKQGFELRSVSNQSATVDFRGRENYLVTFELSDGQVFSFCECPDDDAPEEVVCEHKIAAAIFLREFYMAGSERTALSASDGYTVRTGENGVSSRWKEQLETLLRKNVLRVPQPRPEALLFFSFIRRNHQYVIQPGVVSATAVPPELWRDRAALSEYLLEHQQDPEVRSAICVLPPYQSNSYRWM